MIISLIGYRGSGKSCVAKLLSDRTGWRWIDVDVELEQRTQQTISDIFSTRGEARFRQLEKELLTELLQQDQLILATGGGAILDAETRKNLKASGLVVWLQAPAPVLAERIGTDKKSATQRPSLTGQPVVDEVARVLAAREPLYRETASLLVNTATLTPDEVATRITDQLSAADQGEK